MITWYVIRYLEDFKTSNIEDTDKAGSLSGCFVERFINSIYDPLEELLVKGLWKGFNNEINFIFWLSFCDIFTTDLKNHDLLHLYQERTVSLYFEIE